MKSVTFLKYLLVVFIMVLSLLVTNAANNNINTRMFLTLQCVQVTTMSDYLQQ